MMLFSILLYSISTFAMTVDTLWSVQDTIAIVTDSLITKEDSLTVQRDTLRKIPNGAFAGGEFLKFDVHYGFVTAGEAIMQVTDTIYKGRECHRIDFRVDSKPFFRWIYKVEDRYTTFLDSEGLFPWRFEQHIREGGYVRDFVAEFDQINNIVKTSEGEYRIPSYVHDMMSAFYYARIVDFSGYKVGQKLHLQNFYKDSTYELDVKFKGRQTIEVEAGTFKCLVVEPLAKEGGLFKSEGRVLIWLTDDERKIPVRVSTKVPIGSIDSELVGFHGVNGPVTAKIDEE